MPAFTIAGNFLCPDKNNDYNRKQFGFGPKRNCRSYRVENDSKQFSKNRYSQLRGARSKNEKASCLSVGTQDIIEYSKPTGTG